MNKLVHKGIQLKRLIRQDPSVKVFVHCMQGVNRSVAVVVTFLVLSSQLTLQVRCSLLMHLQPGVIAMGDLISRITEFLRELFK